jgi:hypothetical protein
MDSLANGDYFEIRGNNYWNCYKCGGTSSGIVVFVYCEKPVYDTYKLKLCFDCLNRTKKIFTKIIESHESKMWNSEFEENNYTYRFIEDKFICDSCGSKVKDHLISIEKHQRKNICIECFNKLYNNIRRVLDYIDDNKDYLMSHMIN